MVESRYTRMKRVILPAFAFLALMALPTRSQDDKEADVQDQIDTLQEVVTQHEAQIAELTAYVKSQKAEAERLSAALAKAKQEGYLMAAPNHDAKQAMFDGLTRFARVSSGKKAEPEPAKEE